MTVCEGSICGCIPEVRGGSAFCNEWEVRGWCGGERGKEGVNALWTDYICGNGLVI